MRAPRLLLPMLVAAALLGPSSAAAAPEDPKPRPVETLVRELADGNGSVRAEAARELGRHGPAAAKAAPELVKLLEGSYEPARAEAALALARIDTGERAGLPVLAKLAASPNPSVKARAMDALFLYPAGAEGVPELLLAEVRSKEFGERVAARFRSWGEEGAVHIARALQRDDTAGAELLWPVLEAAGAAGGPLILPLLDHPVEALRLRAADHLAHGLLGTYRADVARALGVLREPAADPARVEEAFAVAVEAGIAAVPGLAGALIQYSEPQVRLRMLAALSRIGPDARGAVPALRHTTTAIAGRVRDAATGALLRIDPDAARVPPRAGKPSPLLACRTGPARAKALPPRSASADAILTGLEWLARHQDGDGGWKCTAFESRCTGGRCGGRGGTGFDEGVSALALLAFLGEGETHVTPRHGEVVCKGIEHLLSRQDGAGAVGRGEGGSGHWIYNHAIATLALAEAYSVTASRDLRAPAQNAANFAVSCQNPYRAWRYGVRPQDNDTSITGWMVLALWAAKRADLDVDPAVFEGAMSWFDKVTEPDLGRAGYTARGNGPLFYEGGPGPDESPPEMTEGNTAQAVLARLLSGAEVADELVGKGVERCGKLLPVYDEASGSVDFHYWHFGSLALHQFSAGSKGSRGWTKWKEAAAKALVDSQRKEKASDRYGSWDPVDRWGFAGGRVYATAINVLTLQTPYRYPRERDSAGR